MPRVGKQPARIPITVPPPANIYVPWGRNVDGDHIGATDNYKVKVMNSRIELPQMKSTGGQPFYFGGSQVPHMLSSSRIFAV